MLQTKLDKVLYLEMKNSNELKFKNNFLLFFLSCNNYLKLYEFFHSSLIEFLCKKKLIEFFKDTHTVVASMVPSVVPSVVPP